MGKNDLRPGQYKRIGRIAEKNPDRAERVAARMTTRSERKDKGKEIASKYDSNPEKTKRPPSNYERKSESYFLSQIDPSTPKTSTMSADQIQSAGDAMKKMGRDYPLSTTPQIKER